MRRNVREVLLCDLPWQVANFAATEITAIDESAVIACPILGCWLRNIARIMLHTTVKI